VRRLVLAFMVLALAVIAGAASAGAAKSGPALKVTGSAHLAGGKLRGGFTVKNEGATTSATLTAAIKILGPKKHGKTPKLTVAHAKVHPLAPGAKQHVGIQAAIPGSVKSGHWSVVVCAGDCSTIGGFAGARNQKKATAPNAPTTEPAPAPAPTGPVCVPSIGPIAYPVEKPFHVCGSGVEYFGFVPASYNPSTSMPLLIWAHGCGGEAEGDAYNVGSYADEPGKGWLALSLGGRDGGCWNPLAGSEQLVMAALADFESHFNVNPKRVILAGYSSGGDLAYRTGFRHSSTFAGLLIENSAPFEQTESTEEESLAAATNKTLHIVHLAHEQDETYELANVESEVAAVKSAGFPITLVKRPGTHFDEPGAIVNGKAVPGTDADVQTYLLPHIEDGWESP
jgi:predicted esterase